jgi:hypothetical protein
MPKKHDLREKKNSVCHSPGPAVAVAVAVESKICATPTA